MAIMNFVIKQLDVKNGDYVMLTDSHMEKHLLILIEIFSHYDWCGGPKLNYT